MTMHEQERRAEIRVHLADVSGRPEGACQGCGSGLKVGLFNLHGWKFRACDLCFREMRQQFERLLRTVRA